MTPQPRHFRIFLSSPGDVASERALVLQVIDNLRTEPLLRDVILTPVAWDDPNSRTPMLAMKTPQQAIDEGLPKPSDCDIVVVIFWSRMGTPLDVDSHGKKLDGTMYLSGTEWEYFDAERGAKESRARRPLIVVYRRTERIALDPVDPLFDQKLEQWRRVEAFFREFHDPITGVFKKGFNEYVTPDGFRKAFETDIKVLLNRLIGEGSDGIHSGTAKTTEPVVLWTGSPFPGLRAFLPKDEPIFFGRGRETDALVKRVSESRFVAVVGASGSGKSSLVGAGLIPRLVNNAIDGSKDWKWLRFTPGGLGDNPFMALAAELKNLTERHGWNARQIADKLLSDPLAIEEIAAAALTDQPVWAELLLFIDQFEELFTLVKPEYVTPFASLLNVLAASKRVRVVVTLRSDFYHRCVDYPVLAELLRPGTFPLSVPDAFALLEMIERPAERAGLAFEADLPKRMVRDTGAEPGGLALLAYTLDELYERCKGKRTLSATDYDALEGVQGAIGTRAENTFTRLDSEAQAAFTSVFRNLVEVDERGTATRQRATLSRFTAGSALLISAFVEARLLTTSEDQQRVPLVEVAHEALLRKWGRLAVWIEATQDDLRLLRQIRNAAQEWEEEDRHPYLLWSHERLTLVYAMQKRLQPELNPVEQNFIEPERTRLLRELDKNDTTHARRRWIGERLANIGDMRSGIGLDEQGVLPQIDWLPVTPGGEIKINKKRFTVEPFYVAKYLTTYVQFQAFLDTPDGFNDDRWWEGIPDDYQKQAISPAVAQYNNSPRDSVSWYQAVAFSRWLDAKYRELDLFVRFPAGNWQIRLPTEWEWQWMAQNGTEDREYAWGTWDEHPRANTKEASIGERSIAVGMYVNGAAGCGALDVTGNLMEWCLNDHNPPDTISMSNKKDKVQRGGSFSFRHTVASTAHRLNYSPHNEGYHYGFRLVVAAVPF